MGALTFLSTPVSVITPEGPRGGAPARGLGEGGEGGVPQMVSLINIIEKTEKSKIKDKRKPKKPRSDL